MSTMDGYFAGLPAAEGEAFRRVRDLALEVVPDAERGESYGMPALRYRGSPLLGFRAASAHLAVYPFSPAAIDLVRDRLDGFSLTKGTIRFTAGHPLPADVVRDLVRFRADEIG
ncbi:DUF1801 domain-containing protein [Actinosynnema sp. NPDC020468]|uniref:iron chaperone n=1 Tax=Actinosynnema sp. NPDC020468 TaxID=3154488 RepID=UPI003408D65E